MGKKYYSVVVKTRIEDGDKVKAVKQLFLVSAESITDAEAKINKEFSTSVEDFDVVSATATTYLKVIE